jgi:hypothetical protein
MPGEATSQPSNLQRRPTHIGPCPRWRERHQSGGQDSGNRTHGTWNDVLSSFYTHRESFDIESTSLRSLGKYYLAYPDPACPSPACPSSSLICSIRFSIRSLSATKASSLVLSGVVFAGSPPPVPQAWSKNILGKSNLLHGDI